MKIRKSVVTLAVVSHAPVRCIRERFATIFNLNYVRRHFAALLPYTSFEAQFSHTSIKGFSSGASLEDSITVFGPD